MADNQTRFTQGMDRITGGIPDKPARAGTRVADSKDFADLRMVLVPVEKFTELWDRAFGALPPAPHRSHAKGSEPRRLADDKDIADLRADIAALRKLVEEKLK